MSRQAPRRLGSMPRRKRLAVVAILALALAALVALGSGGRSQPAEAGELPTATAVSAGWEHTCAITNSGGVKCWGLNSDGQLGDGVYTNSPTPVDVTGLSSNVIQISAGGFHTCALTDQGAVMCWGDGYEGQLGNNNHNADQPNAINPAGLGSGVTQIAASDFSTCALVNGGVKCWGDDDQGAVGDGTTGDASGVPPCYCRDTPTDVAGLTSGVAAIAAGGESACALLDNGGVRCWGDNYNGQAGDGSVSTGLCLCKTTPVTVAGITGATAITVGSHHACALVDSGVKCWGQNYNGQLGDGTEVSRVSPVDVSGLTSGVAKISAGGAYTCAVTLDAALKCWGANFSGQIGDGSTEQHDTPVDVPLSATVSGQPSSVGATIAAGLQSVSTNKYDTCAVSSGGLQCWGVADSGQIGDGTFGDPSCDCAQLPVNVQGFAQSQPSSMLPPIQPSPPAETVANTDMVSAGRGGLRGKGSGSIVLSGVSGTVTRALLFWSANEGVIFPPQIGSADLPVSGSDANVVFNGTPVTGSLIGKASSNCWDNFEESDAYRADVTSLVTGDGTYTLSGFMNATADANGASLIVFFDDGNDSNNQDVVLYEGDESNDGNEYGEQGWNVWMNGFQYAVPPASLTLHVADGQNYVDGALLVNGQQVVGAGHNWEGDSVPFDSASAAQNLGGLWDIDRYNVGPQLGSNASTVSIQSLYNDDCASIIVAALGVPVGSVPPALTWGNNNCSGGIDGADGLSVLDHVAQLDVTSVQGTAQCPPIGQQLGFPGGPLWGDVNCSDSIDAQDMIVVLEYFSGLPLDVPSGCGRIGQEIGPL